MTSMASLHADVDLHKLSYEIFSLLGSKFLFDGSVSDTPRRPVLGEGGGRVRVLTIDGCRPSPGDALRVATALCGRAGGDAVPEGRGRA
jgi:hypothetical protein